jgi:transcriptional regulator with XRE-family HTH domain
MKMVISYENFPNILREIRKSQKWTQKELADELDISPKTVDLWERTGPPKVLPKFLRLWERIKGN